MFYHSKCKKYFKGSRLKDTIFEDYAYFIESLKLPRKEARKRIQKSYPGTVSFKRQLRRWLNTYDDYYAKLFPDIYLRNEKEALKLKKQFAKIKEKLTDN